MDDSSARDVDAFLHAGPFNYDEIELGHRLSLSLFSFSFFNLAAFESIPDRFDALKSNRATLLFDKDASEIYAVECDFKN